VATRLGCERAAVGLLKGRSIKLVGVSHSAQFDERANLLRAVENAMAEAVDQGEVVVSPPPRDDLPVVAHAHDVLLRESGAGAAATFPLVCDGEVVGALSLERAAPYRFDPESLQLGEALAAVAGRSSSSSAAPGHLALHAGRSATSLWKKLTGPRHPGLKLVAVLTAARRRSSRSRPAPSACRPT
jgi:transcriptional regulator with GAF, ATPase, and Fis domain